MRQVMVRYRVKPECVAENEELVRAVYDELAETAPDGLHYVTFKLDDGVTFVHIAATAADNPLGHVEAFARFQEAIAERCDEPPAVTVLSEVGSYRAFGAVGAP
jgi:hypothetical protein